MYRLGVALHPGFSLVCESRVEADVKQQGYDLPLQGRLQSATQLTGGATTPGRLLVGAASSALNQIACPLRSKCS